MQSKGELICIDPGQVGHFWPHVEPLLKPAIENVGLSDFGDIAGEILSGRALVWIVWDGERITGAVATCLQRIAGDLVCIIVACGGADMRQGLPLLEKIEGYARDEGCKAVRIFGREGWLRVLNDYRQTAIVIEKELA